MQNKLLSFSRFIISFTFLLTSCHKKKEAINILDISPTLKSSLSYKIPISYLVHEEREIILELWSGDNIIASNSAIVNNSKDRDSIYLTTHKFPEEKDDYFFKAYIRPVSFHVRYEATYDREIILVMVNSERKKIGTKIKYVDAGIGVDTMSIKFNSLPKPSEFIDMSLNIRPRKTGRKQTTFRAGFCLLNDPNKGFVINSEIENNKNNKNNFISISHNGSIKSNKLNKLNLEYSIEDKSKIEIIIRDLNNKWLGSKKIDLRKGSGKIELAIKLTRIPKNKGLIKIFAIATPFNNSHKKFKSKIQKFKLD